jgi:hypothetical protein
LSTARTAGTLTSRANRHTRIPKETYRKSVRSAMARHDFIDD